MKENSEPVNPELIYTITAGRTGDAPDNEGSHRLAMLNQGLTRFPRAEGSIIGRYLDNKGVSLGHIYYNTYCEAYPKTAGRIVHVVDRYDASVDNIGHILSENVKRPAGFYRNFEICLCTYRGHYNWLRHTFYYYGYSNVTLLEVKGTNQTNPSQDKVLERVTRKDQTWERPMGRILRTYVKRDARKFRKIHPGKRLSECFLPDITNPEP